MSHSKLDVMPRQFPVAVVTGGERSAATRRTHPSPPSLRWWPTSCRASAPPRPWASSRPSRRSRSSPGTPGCGSTHLVAPPVVVDDAIDFPAISFPGYDDMMHRTKGAARRAWPRGRARGPTASRCSRHLGGCSAFALLARRARSPASTRQPSRFRVLIRERGWNSSTSTSASPARTGSTSASRAGPSPPPAVEARSRRGGGARKRWGPRASLTSSIAPAAALSTKEP